MRLLIALVLVLLATCTSVRAQDMMQDDVQGKMDTLMRLLDDPDIRAFLAERHTAGSVSGAPEVSGFGRWEAAVRERLTAAFGAVPLVPSEVASAAIRIREDARSTGHAPVLVVMLFLVLAGSVAEAAFRRRMATSSSRSDVSAFLPIAVFAVTMAFLFFAYPWPPLARAVMLSFLCAFVAYRLVSTGMTLAVADRRVRSRLRVLTGMTVTGVALAFVGPRLGVEPAVTDAVSYLFSLAVLGATVEAIWSLVAGGAVKRLSLTLAVVAIWGVWCLDLDGLFWIGVYAFVLPPVARAVGHAVRARVAEEDGNDVRAVLLVRGSRVLVIALAAAWLAFVWRVDVNSLAHQSPFLSGVLYGLLKSVVVLLLADLVWHLARSAIDRRIIAGSSLSTAGPAQAARDGRLRPLLPILRNVLAVLVIVVTTLVVLAELGVQIAPLLAGAGIFGVALGFGSQTLVKDVIGGVFYMLDDAFRVGEYIQAKDYKGTVEGFSLRSVKLRHHRGPVYTVPFGELGAVQNMSRDWVIDKFRITVGFDTDLEKARKITKRIGAELQADPELGSQFIQPLKMKGVEDFGDYGIVLSFAMTTVPGQQTFIRRKAYAMIREAFRAEGIDFAQPTVQVGGDDRDAGAAAAALLRAGSPGPQKGQ